MDEQERLTGFSQSRYNRGMTEGTNGTLDKESDLFEKDISSIQSDAELAEAKRQFVVAEQERKSAYEQSKSKGSMQETIRRYEDILELESKRKEIKKRDEGTPPIVLRKEDDLTEFGLEWTKEDKEVMIELLQKNEVFKLNEISAINAVDNFIATGKTAEQIRNLFQREDFKNVFEEETNPYIEKLGTMNPDQEMTRRKTYFLYETMGIKNEKYIQRFILDEDYHYDLQRDYDGDLPANIFELAWQINYNDPEQFGVQGRYPVLQMEVTKNKDGEVKGRYVVNQANFIRWIRSRMMYYQDKDEDELTNYLSAVKLPKTMRPVDLNELVDEKARYFTDEEGNEYNGLYAEMLSEVIALFHLRNHDLEYEKAMGTGKELSEKLNELYFKSKLTKKSFEKSYFNVLTTIPLDYNGEKSDDTFGGAVATLYLAYYNLGDFKELQKTLGPNSKFFTREGMLEAITEVYKEKNSGTFKSHDMITFLGEDASGHFDKAFGADGKIKDSKAFTNLVNYYSVAMSTSHILQDVVKQGLKDALRERYEFKSKEQNNKAKDKNEGEDIVDKASWEMVWLVAHSMMRFTGGAAKNDTKAQGYDYAKKWMDTEAYRRKMASVKRGNGAGNFHTVPMFKSVMVDLMRAMNVTEAYAEVKDQLGNTVYKQDKDGKRKAVTRKKTPLEIFQEINTEKARQKEGRRELEQAFEQAPENEKRKRQKALDDYDVRMAKVSSQIAGQLVFKENAMRDYAINHVSKSYLIYEQIMSAKEINFEKFTKYDTFRGITFDRSEFQKELQAGLLHPIRYLFQNYGDLNYNMPVRYNKFKGREGDEDKYEFETMPLGEAMFGYELLNIPEFRMNKKDKNGKDIKGRYEKDPSTGRYVIDYNKVQNDKSTLYKQWVLMKLGADLWTHIDRHSTDPSYNVSYYFNVLDALATIPGEVYGDDEKMRNVLVAKSYFSKKQIRWLRQMSGTTNYRLFWKAMLDDFGRHVDEPGLSQSFSLIISSIFRGYEK